MPVSIAAPQTTHSPRSGGLRLPHRWQLIERRDVDGSIRVASADYPPNREGAQPTGGTPDGAISSPAASNEPADGLDPTANVRVERSRPAVEIPTFAPNSGALRVLFSASNGERSTARHRRVDDPKELAHAVDADGGDARERACRGFTRGAVRRRRLGDDSTYPGRQAGLPGVLEPALCSQHGRGRRSGSSLH